jgi:hypothetical protein
MTACEDHVKDCKILTQFNVEPEENWILYHGGKGEVVHGKAKPKMFGKYETWITNDKQIRDPHACLAKDQVCKVSIFRLSNFWHLQITRFFRAKSLIHLHHLETQKISSVAKIWILYEVTSVQMNL